MENIMKILDAGIAELILDKEQAEAALTLKNEKVMALEEEIKACKAQIAELTEKRDEQSRSATYWYNRYQRLVDGEPDDPVAAAAAELNPTEQEDDF